MTSSLKKPHIEVTELDRCPDMCGGTTIYYDVKFYGETVLDAINAIRDYTTNPNCEAKFHKVADFGNIYREYTGATWEIKIDYDHFIGSWINEDYMFFTGEYDSSLLYKKVEKITGVDYCPSGINFTIHTVKE